MARASAEPLPCLRMIVYCNPCHASAGISSATPYTAVVIGAKWFSPIQPVANGMSEIQNNRCIFVHSITPSTCRTKWNKWVVIPVNRYIDKTEDINEKDRCQC